MTKELIRNTKMSDFIKLPKIEQQKFLTRVKISELKAKEDLPLLKKL
ncbi:MAG: hypothetical protein H0U73_00960 [Tatlockia sp.]|nr:hypothetical protein [Tatlockia sp.]